MLQVIRRRLQNMLTSKAGQPANHVPGFTETPSFYWRTSSFTTSSATPGGYHPLCNPVDTCITDTGRARRYSLRLTPGHQSPLRRISCTITGIMMRTSSLLRALPTSSGRLAASSRVLTTPLVSQNQNVQQQSRQAHAISNPTLANIEKRWEALPPQEQADLWMALRDRMKVDWNELTVQEKKAGV